MKFIVFILSFFILVVDECLTREIYNSETNKITGIRVGQFTETKDNKIQIIIETQKKLNTKIYLLQNPWRLVLDCPNTIWNIRNLNTKGSLEIGSIVEYRFGEQIDNLGRLVFQFNKPLSPLRIFRMQPSKNSHRLVIEIIESGEISFIIAQKALSNNSLNIEDYEDTSKIKNTKQIEQYLSFNKAKSKLEKQDKFIAKNNFNRNNHKIKKNWVVAIDAGHGGKDPGAVGYSGSFEKDITLIAAKELSKELKLNGQIIPILIRKNDKYLFLRERINLARKKKADLFISLHADAAISKDARGISIFSLSDVASDKEAEYLAKKENLSDLIGDPNLKNEELIVKNTLINMFQRESMNESTKLAEYLLKEFQTLPNVKQRGHRFAGFAVLKSHDIPSLLIEMGFLSNKEDEKKLLSKNYRKRLIKRIAIGIEKYISSFQ